MKANKNTRDQRPETAATGDDLDRLAAEPFTLDIDTDTADVFAALETMPLMSDHEIELFENLAGEMVEFFDHADIGRDLERIAAESAEIFDRLAADHDRVFEDMKRLADDLDNFDQLNEIADDLDTADR